MRRAWMLAALAVACHAPSPSAPAAKPAPGAPWVAHMQNELMPFWMHPDAMGDPVGNFPSVRCDDGKKLDRQKPCPEIGHDEWLMMDLNYVVAMSRQTYGYGVAFHVTGDPKYLALARAGVSYLRAHALDPAGGAFAVWNGTKKAWEPEAAKRNPQELAYAALGMAFYYYLTRDPAIWADIVKLKDTIFASRFDAELGALKWQDDVRDKKLVAQLDQLNAYLLLLAPTVTGPERAAWLSDMQRIVTIMRKEFYSEEENLFFPRANTREEVSTRTSEADFGHSIKSFWMMRFVGRELGDAAMVSFAEERGMKVLQRAFLPATGSWARAVKKSDRSASGAMGADQTVGGAIDERKEWWIYDELDQFAATMTLTSARATAESYLARTYPYFLEHFVDHQHGETWTFVEADGEPSHDMPKAWPWKSGYHNMEHALVAYITAQGSHHEPATLYFGFHSTPPATSVRPYFFSGHLAKLEPAGERVQRAEFDRIE